MLWIFHAHERKEIHTQSHTIQYYTLSKSIPLSSRDETTLAIGTGEISGYCYTKSLFNTNH